MSILNEKRRGKPRNKDEHKRALTDMMDLLLARFKPAQVRLYCELFAPPRAHQDVSASMVSSWRTGTRGFPSDEHRKRLAEMSAFLLHYDKVEIKSGHPDTWTKQGFVGEVKLSLDPLWNSELYLKIWSELPPGTPAINTHVQSAVESLVPPFLSPSKVAFLRYQLIRNLKNDKASALELIDALMEPNSDQDRKQRLEMLLKKIKDLPEVTEAETFYSDYPVHRPYARRLQYLLESGGKRILYLFLHESDALSGTPAPILLSQIRNTSASQRIKKVELKNGRVNTTQETLKEIFNAINTGCRIEVVFIRDPFVPPNIPTLRQIFDLLKWLSVDADASVSYCVLWPSNDPMWLVADSKDAKRIIDDRTEGERTLANIVFPLSILSLYKGFYILQGMDGFTRWLKETLGLEVDVRDSNLGF